MKEKNIDINQAMDLLVKGELKNAGYDISILAVVDPVDFDMQKPKIFNNDFCFILNTTNKKQWYLTIEDTKKWLDQLKQPKIFNIDIDDFVKDLVSLTKKQGSSKDNALLFTHIFSSYLWLVLISSAGRPIFVKTFAIETKKAGDVFWLYVGTKKLTDDEIMTLYKAKVDFLEKKSGRRSFNFIVTKREIAVKNG